MNSALLVPTEKTDESALLMPGERIDEIGFGNLKLIQKPEEFCYGVDAVILADYAASSAIRNNKMEKVIDLGTGTGIIPVILSHKTMMKEIHGIELQRDSFDRACRNARINNLENRLTFHNLDILECEQKMKEYRGFFDMVTSNPPYMTGGAGITNKNPAKMIARHETSADLGDFIRTAASLLRDKGELFMVHRPSRLVDICQACRENKLEPKEMRFASPDKNTKPNILLIRCVKNGGAELKLMDPLYIYAEEGRHYTEEIRKIYEK